MVESKIKYIRIINIEKKGPCFKKASVNTKPAIYPHGIDPESPKNIFADGLLCLKKKEKPPKLLNLETENLYQKSSLMK